MNRFITSMAAVAIVCTVLPAYAQQPASVDIGSFDMQTGDYTLDEYKLVTTFEDGGPIMSFELVSIGSSYFLARYGNSASQQSYAQLVPVSLVSGPPNTSVAVIRFNEIHAHANRAVCTEINGCPRVNGGGCVVKDEECTCKIVLPNIDPITRQNLGNHPPVYDDTRCGWGIRWGNFTLVAVIQRPYWP